MRKPLHREKKRSASDSNSAYKQGNASVEVVIVVAVLFVFALAAIFIYDFFTDITNDIIADPDYSDTATAPARNLHAQYPSIFDTALS